jgi:uncharacterized protein (DUF362 family)
MKKDESLLNRRQLLKTLGIGTLALGFSRCATLTTKNSDTSARIYTGHGKHATWEKVQKPSKVSLVKGNDCRDNTFNALMNIEDDIMASLEGKKRILLKPNFVNTNKALCATRVEAVRAILDFLKPRWKGPIEIGESPWSKNGTFEGFKNYGYLPLEKEYGVTLSDLNEQPYHNLYLFRQGNIPTRVRIISTFFDKDQYIISAAKLKTHNSVLVTASLKNILMSAPLNDYKGQNDKSLMHSRLPNNERTKNDLLHFNLFHLAQSIFPDLGVIDGYEAMEGNGPQDGTPFDARIAMASLDPLALDSLATKIMGFDAKEIMYLSSMNEAGMGQGDLDKIQVIGTDLNDCLYKFRPNDLLLKPYGLG